MNKVAAYLQGHLSGEVLVSDGAREFFSTDASILQVKPAMVIYPRTTNDVRKVARFTWQLAEKGHVMPMTARGSGTDQTGAAIGKGAVIVFPAHMNKILELDSKQKMVRVQPGLNFKSLEETLHTHGLFLPPYPASYQYSTIGGAIANNTAGEKSLKYGQMRHWVDALEVVLANGEVIQTGRLSRRDVDKKKGLPGLEGEIYRAVDGILVDNAELINNYDQSIQVSKDSVGYALAGVRKKDGSIDLTPLLVGSQGTLGIVTEAIIKAAPYTPQAALLVAAFDNLDTALEAVEAMRPLAPSALEMVDKHLLEFVAKNNSVKNYQAVVGEDAAVPEILLFIEFDDLKDGQRDKHVKKAIKLLQAIASGAVVASDPDEQQKLWGIRHSAAAVINYDQGGRASLPIIEDGIVPLTAFRNFVSDVYELFAKNHLEAAIWGHAGDANIHLQPLLDLRKTADRQKVFKIMDEYYKLVLKYGGSIAAEHNDGRLRAPYVASQVGQELADVYAQIKAAFDPHGTLNPGVKLGTSLKDVAGLLRDSYSIAHLADQLPRT
ncbi:FAD-binding protein [Candidatus Saccharibacteria bacterium]|nr:MAG: FAD-binding protein [Candidatus Saccharibacteria bacterium]